MDKSQVIQVVEAALYAPKAANIIVEWLRPAKVRKTCVDIIQKHVRMVGRVGLDYDNQKAVIAKRESGDLPAKNAGLPWGNWEIFPYLIEHKGAFYLRLYNGTSKTMVPMVEWLLNGTVVPYEVIENELLASEKRDDDGECFCCKVENMLQINGEQFEDAADAVAVPSPS